jgi:predicted nucleotidyltransferase
MRNFRDRDYIQTLEKYFFCVVGPYHPFDRVIAYLKYVPASDGKWGKADTKFKRVLQAYTIPNLLETFDFLKNNHPQYVFHSPFYNIAMTAVPHECILKHYRPEEKLANLLKTQNLDSLQKKLTKLINLLAEKSNVSHDFFGVTGSILLDIHNPEFSDMDIIVYGLENSYAVKNALKELYSSPTSSAQRLEGECLRKWCENKVKNFPISMGEALKIYERKWNLGMFENTIFSVHPVKLEEEVKEKYGDETFFPIGIVTVRALVYDNKDSMFLPAVYHVKDVEVIEGVKVEDIRKIVSYEGLYDSLAEKGETILARGKLERVVNNRTGTEYYRVLVGSPEGKGKEYIKLA